MKEVNILTADAVEKPADFNLPEFTRQVFDMYDGSTETVTLLCKNDMMNYIIDRFGDDVETAPLDYAHFKAVAKVSVSQTFLGWVFQFNGDIKIIDLVTVVDRYKNDAGKRSGQLKAQTPVPLKRFISSVKHKSSPISTQAEALAQERI